LRQADRAVIEVGPNRIDVTVSVAGAEEHEILWKKLIAVAPFFAKYQTKVEREIPMAVLTPVP
jgi:F420H(2)-dependent quinone reductase